MSRISLALRVGGCIAAASLVMGIALTLLLRKTGDGLVADASERSASDLRQRLTLLETVGRQHFASTVRDYGFWDGMSAFVSAPSDPWRDENFDASAMEQLGVDWVLVLDADGQPLVNVASMPGLRRLSVGHQGLAAWDPCRCLYAVAAEPLHAVLSLDAVQRVLEEKLAGVATVPWQGQWLDLAVSSVPDSHAAVAEAPIIGAVVFARMRSVERLQQMSEQLGATVKMPAARAARRRARRPGSVDQALRTGHQRASDSSGALRLWGHAGGDGSPRVRAVARSGRRSGT